MRLYGTDHLVREFLGNRGSSALLTLLFLMIVVVEFGALAILIVEKRSPDANITNASDAVWYLYVTITTVGYGDRYPVTNAGRIIGVVVMTMGVGLFGTLTGFLANFFLAPKPAPEAPKAEAQQ
jgi:voltage-gated potassium channel